MRKFLGGLIAVVAAVLLLAAPAMAQGTGDPLGLISSGAVIPFIGGTDFDGGSLSFLELSSPVGDNSGLLTGGIGGAHMFFFDKTCKRSAGSVGIPLTTNDFIITRVDNLDQFANAGLITLGGVDATGFSLVPLTSPIHAHVFWFDTLTDNVRMMEPIGLAQFEGDQTWNPLRTGATFVAPLEGVNVGAQANAHTTLYLICPTRSITSGSASSPFPAGNNGPFPLLEPISDPTISPSLRGRIYGNSERFLRDVSTNCTCLTAVPVLSITAASDVYNDVANATFGTLTELEGNLNANVPPVQPVCGQPQTGPGNANGDCRQFAVSGTACSAAQLGTVNPATGNPDDICKQFLIVTPGQPGGGAGQVSFTGYRAILQNGRDSFSRLSNGSSGDLQGGTGAQVPTGPGSVGGR